jgi:SAM-dependent methyltransferase
MTSIDYAAEWERRARTDARHEAHSDTRPGAWIASAYGPLASIFRGLGPVLEPGVGLFEIGAGPGRLAVPVAHAVRTLSGQVVGIDVAPTMVAAARAYARESGADNASFALTPGGALPIRYPFDGGYAVTVFQHLDPDDVRDYLYSVAGVLRVGGRFAFQYVEGSERAPWMYQFLDIEVEHLVAAARLEVVDRWRDPYQPNWRWIVAAKTR